MNNIVDITEDLIIELINQKKWGNPESLREFGKKGWKWNLTKNSLVSPPEAF